MNDLFTRFRVYAMPHGGVSMSYAVDTSFILIEGRYNEDNREKIKSEMKLTGKESVDLLHISTWDVNRCNPEELESLLEELQPLEIEYPAYSPTNENEIKSRRLINEYLNHSIYADRFEIGPNSLMNLSELDDIQYLDPILSPMERGIDATDNSIVKLFRGGRFGVLNMSNCYRDNGILSQIRTAKIENSINVVVLNNLEEMHSSDFLQELIGFVKPGIIILLSNKMFGVLKDTPLSKQGISVSISEQKDIIVKYGLSKYQQELSVGSDFKSDNVLYKGYSVEGKP